MFARTFSNYVDISANIQLFSVLASRCLSLCVKKRHSIAKFCKFATSNYMKYKQELI